MKFNFYRVVLLFLCVAQFSWSQERTKDSIEDQVVNVVKPYQPTISDAFKVKEIPVLNDSNTIQKKSVKYNIFSIPVASTFTPAKGRAANVDKQKRPKLFDNYASLGLGTFRTFLGEVYLSHELRNEQVIGGYFGHHSSFGQIEGVRLDNSFSKTQANVDFSQNNDDLSWNVNLGYDFSYYNWYGLPDMIYSDEEINSINPKHSFNTFSAGGQLRFDESFFNSGDISFKRFSDSYSSGENIFNAAFDFDIPLRTNQLENSIWVDYINGSFNRNYFTAESLNYGFVNVGLGTSYVLTEDDLTVNLGVRLVYLNNIELGENKFYIYPNIEATYRLVSDVVIAFGGITGDLNQNSYHGLASENPFVSPTLLIAPTDQQYNAFLGIKGKLSNDIGYSIRGGYMNEANKPLYILNPALTFAEENYQFGNSFGVVYDEVTTISIQGELNVDVSRNFTLGLKGAYFNYNTKAQKEAWNLPDFTSSLFIDYQISEQWFTGVSAFFVGERKDQFEAIGSFVEIEPETVVLESYFDINAHLGYRINSQFSMFAKVNNIANQSYERWLNFPVQGIQFIAGATYQFDF